MHLRKPGHWITPKEYISNYMKDSRMLTGALDQEENEEGPRENLSNEEQQTANILANLDDIVIPTMDTDACADIAEDDPMVAVEECKVTNKKINVMRISSGINVMRISSG